MKLFTFYLLIYTTAVVTGDSCSKSKYNCDTRNGKYIGKIYCKVGGTLCTCEENKISKEDVCPDISIDSHQMDWEKCKSYCGDAESCKYFKFIEYPDNSDDFPLNELKSICFLMNDEQCTNVDDFCCEAPHCRSGGKDCVEDVETKYKCKTGTDHKTGNFPMNYLRWDCKDLDWNSVDIYNSTVEAPGGTRCTARPDCHEKKYVYTCKDDPSSNDESTGIWTWDVDGENDPECLNSDKTLNEAICNAEDIVLKNYVDQAAQGLEIQCVEGGAGQVDQETGTITSQNNCLLLCDWYPVLTFYTVGQEWRYRMVDDEEEDHEEHDLQTDTPDQIIYCWTD